jgi:DNA-binding NarL/FixJ family response regulator
MLTIIACTDEPVVELGVKALLASDPEIEILAICKTHQEAVAASAELRPDLIVYGLAVEQDLGAVHELRRIAPHCGFVLWAREVSTEAARRMMDAGVKGFVSTTASPQTFRECLRISGMGEIWMEKTLSLSLLNTRPIVLSRRQTQLVGLLVQGLKNKEIATALGISEGTVKAYLTTLYEKVGAKDRFELALFGLKNMREFAVGNASTAGAGTASAFGSEIRKPRPFAFSAQIVRN